MVLVSDVLEHNGRIYSPLKLANMKIQKLTFFRNTAPNNRMVLNFMRNPDRRIFLLKVIASMSRRICCQGKMLSLYENARTHTNGDKNLVYLLFSPAKCLTDSKSFKKTHQGSWKRKRRILIALEQTKAFNNKLRAKHSHLTTISEYIEQSPLCTDSRSGYW